MAVYIPKCAEIESFVVIQNGKPTGVTFLGLEMKDVENLVWWDSSINQWVTMNIKEKDEIRKRLFERDHPNHKKELAFATTPEQVAGMMNQPEEDILTLDEVKEIFSKTQGICSNCNGFGVIGSAVGGTREPCPVCMVKEDNGCDTCDGTGAFIDPPLEVQKAEAEAGQRKWLTQRPCPTCCKQPSEELQLPDTDTTTPPEESWRDRPPML